MKEDFKFNIQLFAEGEGGEDAPADPTVTEGGQDPTQAPAQAQSTILGDDPSKTDEPPKQDEDPKQDTKSAVPDKYDFAAITPEGAELDQAIVDEYSTMAKEIGLSNEHASKLAEYGMKLQKQAAESVVAAFAKQVDGWGETAKTELGDKFDGTVKQAAQGIQALSEHIPNLRAALNETGAGNRVEIIKLMALVGQMTTEDNGMALLKGSPKAAAAHNPYPNTDFTKY